MIITIFDKVFGVEYDINIKFLRLEVNNAKEKIWKGTCTLSNLRAKVGKAKENSRIKKGKIKIKAPKP
jgi:hypothetical protein